MCVCVCVHVRACVCATVCVLTVTPRMCVDSACVRVCVYVFTYAQVCVWLRCCHVLSFIYFYLSGMQESLGLSLSSEHRTRFQVVCMPQPADLYCHLYILCSAYRVSIL